ncbi:hypothetical protein FRB97_004831, partial [Tulasnella sp. 331]
ENLNQAWLPHRQENTASRGTILPEIIFVLFLELLLRTFLVTATLVFMSWSAMALDVLWRTYGVPLSRAVLQESDTPPDFP